MRAFMAKCGIVLAGLISAAYPACANPSVSNIAVSQRENTKLVDISYDVLFVGGDTVDITCEVSTNAGASFDVPASSFSGDYGANISAGAGRHIVWNAGVDWNENYSEQMMVRITAAAPRFQVLDDYGFLIMDNQTGLLWNQFNTDLLSYISALSESDANYQFYIDSILTSYSGWRMPTLEEFLELADAPTVSGLPYRHPFMISSAAYWTSDIITTLLPDSLLLINGFSFYDRDGSGYTSGGVYRSTSGIPISENATAKLMLVREP